MRKNNVEGTKIAQAAKDLNVTSVTIRRYLTEFNIETMSDENGIKVLPPQAMDELHEIRRLKEEGNTNPKVMEFLEEKRAKGPSEAVAKPRAKAKAKVVEAEKPAAAPIEEDEEEEEVAPAAPPRRTESRPTPTRKPVRRVIKHDEETAAEVEPAAAAAESEAPEGEPQIGEDGEVSGDNRSKHSLTCQTCGKTFEHMNPRLRDCLDCYRAKRKERRRGGSDRHKNVIQHPLAQQVVSKGAQQQPPLQAPAQTERGPRESREPREPREPRESRELVSAMAPTQSAPQPAVREAFIPTNTSAPVVQRTSVRNYRKAIEETRQITGSLKRRLERPDLPEGERRWLEQIYAYQLILHQGWRHLAEYKAAGQAQGLGKSDD
jgi:DNA-binding transcriptional MerR regulator